MTSTHNITIQKVRAHSNIARNDKHILKQDISPLCNLCPLKQNDNYLHLLSCCTNKHINNLYTSQHNKAIHTYSQHTTSTLYHKLLQTHKCGNTQQMNTKNTIPSWLLSCSCYLPWLPARLRPNILCIHGATPTAKPPFSPNPDKDGKSSHA